MIYILEWKSFDEAGQRHYKNLMKGIPHGWNALGDMKNVLIKVSNKYLDFLNIFDKSKADLLLEHSKHDMAIKFKAR